VKKSETTKRTNGSGSVYFRASDSRWCASLSLPAHDGGKPRRVTRTAKTQAGAKSKLLELRREMIKTGDVETSALSVEKWMRTWLDDISALEVRPKTTASYRTTVTQYIIPAIGSKRLRDLSPDNVRACLKFVTDKGLSTRSAALTYQVLSLALKAAYREGKTTRNVCDLVNRPRTAKPVLTVLKAEDGIKVLETVASDRLGSRWAAALLTGARQGEVIGLEWDRVDFLRGRLDLSWQLQRISWEHGCGGICGRKRGTDCPSRKLTAPADWEHRRITGGLWWSRPKSSAGWRIIPLVEPLLSILERRHEASVLEPNPFGLVWTQPSGQPLDPARDNAAWHESLALASVPDARLHDARHTTASLLGRAGVPIEIITKILGHSTYAMSREYMDVDLGQLAGALTKMSALMAPADRTPITGQ
jgi:integrase